MAALGRSDLTALVSRLMAGDYTDSDELNADADRLRSGVAHPDVLGLIFHPDSYFDHEPSVAEVVERASTYRAVAL